MLVFIEELNNPAYLLRVNIEIQVLLEIIGVGKYIVDWVTR
jgi:hypothetical protein